MKARLAEIGVPALFGVLGLATITMLVAGFFAPTGVQERPLDVERSGDSPTAGASSTLNTPAVSPNPTPAPTPNASSVAGGAAFVEMPGSWPGFRGPQRDNVSTEAVPLTTDFNASPPRPLWTVALGEGYAAPAVHKGRVYVIDYDEATQSDVLRCFSLATGGELWRTSYQVPIKRNHGISRTIPAVNDRYVVSLGPKCHLLCADATTGKRLWMVDLVAEYGTVVPEWYAGQCPLIDGDRAIIATGGKALLVAFDLATGKPVWKSPNPRGWQMTHSCVAPMELSGQKTYVYCGTGGVAGLSAKDGRILWDSTEWIVDTATVPTPVPVGGNKVFLTGGYNAGAMMLEIASSGTRFVPRVVYRLEPTVFGSDQQTPILSDGYLYGVIPGGQLACLDLSGKLCWKSGSAGRFGLGPYMLAGGYLYVMNDTGTLTVVRASPDGFRSFGQTKVLPGPESWGPLALAGGLMLARDAHQMVCLDLRKNP